MKQLKIYSDNNGYTIISNRFFDEYMKDANDAQLKVYLYLVRAMSSNMNISISDIADKFNYTERDIIRSLEYWEKINLLQFDYDEQRNIVAIHIKDLSKSSTDQAEKQHPTTIITTPIIVPSEAEVTSPISKTTTSNINTPKKTYTAKDIAKFTSNEEFGQIRFVAETYLGKLLSGNDLKSLLFIYDELQMSVELMDYLIEYCVEKDKKDLRYIKKVAMDWTDSGIKTVQQAKLRAGKYDKSVYTIMKALGRNNTPTDTETDFIYKWLNKYEFSLDIILFACEKTVLATNSHRMNYADGVLTKWHKQGLKTKEQIEESEQEFKQEKKSTVKTPSKPTTKSNNAFNKFEQNSYNFVSLEEELTEN